MTAQGMPALKLVFARLDPRSLCSAMEVCRSWRAVAEDPSLWKVLSFQGRPDAGQFLKTTISLRRFAQVEEVNLEFAQGVDDTLLQCLAAAPTLLKLNLNACQQVTDKGVAAVASFCPNLVSFSLYWNLRVTDEAVASLTAHCRGLVQLNFSGCKNLTDESMELVAAALPLLLSLDVTRCIRLSDNGLRAVLRSCSQLQELRLYALSSLSDEAFTGCGALVNMRTLDLTGLQRLSDDGLSALARGGGIKEIVLTWCVRVTDRGVSVLAQHGCALELLSLHGILGVTDACLDAVSRTCRESLRVLDVNGCIGIKRRSRDALQELFPSLHTFVVHK